MVSTSKIMGSESEITANWPLPFDVTVVLSTVHNLDKLVCCTVFCPLKAAVCQDLCNMLKEALNPPKSKSNCIGCLKYYCLL